MTADDIRKDIAGYDQPSFDAFRRAFERDKEALRAMGIPLEVRTTDPFSEQADGYIIEKSNYYLPELDLEPDEVAALSLAADAVLGGAEEAGSGMLKISIAEPAEPSPGRVTWGADIAAEQPHLGPLYAALLEHAPVTFEYESADGNVTSREVEPYGLIHRRGNWYLVANDRSHGEPRTFKVSRIKSEVETSGEAFEMPAEFKAADYVAKESWETGAEDITAVVRFDEGLAWWVEQNLTGYRSVPSATGTEVEIPVANPEALISWAIEFGDQFEIVSPESLRRLLCERLTPHIPRTP